jgi:uncharacterized RDD family membrane protein YckC
MNWYYADQGRQKGPVEEPALDELVHAGVVRDDTLVWHEGMRTWEKHSSVRGFAPPSAFPSPPALHPTGDAEVRYCGECGRPFSANELVAIGPVSVCATCKPIYLQKMREGGGLAVGTRRYAGFWIRFAALFVDGLLLGVVFLIILIPFGILAPFGIAVNAPGIARNPGMLAAMIGTSPLVTLASYVAGACYEIFFIANRGATLGKMLFGLKVIRADGSPLSVGLSTGRYFAARWLNMFILGIGYLMAAFDDQKRGLHDRICETRVIHSR